MTQTFTAGTKFTATIYSDRVETHGIIGRRLVRRLLLTGMRNTAGEPEVYKVEFDGTYNDGSVRAYVQVQRSNGSFALLNSNKHRSQISRVLRVAAETGAEADYLNCNSAAINPNMEAGGEFPIA